MILSGSSETNISVSKNGTSIVYHLNVSPYDWTTMFCYQTAKLVDLILMELSEKSQLYSEYSQYNPDSFEYGKLNASLIESSPSNTYFYNLASQKSIQEDRLQLYTHFLKGNIDRSYLTNSCPMYQKLQVIKLQITTYILS